MTGFIAPEWKRRWAKGNRRNAQSEHLEKLSEWVHDVGNVSIIAGPSVAHLSERSTLIAEA